MNNLVRRHEQAHHEIAHLSFLDEPNRVCHSGNDRPVANGLNEPLLPATCAACALSSRGGRVVVKGAVNVWKVRLLAVERGKSEFRE